MSRTLWINTGELSGDMQAAALLGALRQREPDLVAVGMGGSYLEAQGQENLLRVEDLSVMGIAEVVSAIPRALRMLGVIKEQLRRLRPAAVLLVDAPEFNFRVARIAHELGVPVLYFIPPKVWAWRTGRVHFLRRHVRKLYCILPFEPAFYAAHGLAVDYVGNPLVDMVNFPALKGIAPLPDRVGLMPGSRRKELEALLPLFGETARLLHQRQPQLTFHCLRAPNVTETALRALWPADIPLTVEEPDNRYAFMRTCQALLVASGTATLETALAGVPTVVTYKVSPLSGFVGRWLIKVPYVSLPNLIANAEVFPELLLDKATPPQMATALSRLLPSLWSDSTTRETMLAGMDEVRQRCGSGGSAERAADCLLRDLEAL